MEPETENNTLAERIRDEHRRIDKGCYADSFQFHNTTEYLIESSDPRLSRLATYATICQAADRTSYRNHEQHKRFWRGRTVVNLNDFKYSLLCEHEIEQDEAAKNIELNIDIANKVAARTIPTITREKEQIAPTYRASDEGETIILLYRLDGTRYIQQLLKTTINAELAEAERQGYHIRAAWQGVNLGYRADDRTKYLRLAAPLLIDFLSGGKDNTFDGSEDAIHSLDALLTGKAK